MPISLPHASLAIGTIPSLVLVYTESNTSSGDREQWSPATFVQSAPESASGRAVSCSRGSLPGGVSSREILVRHHASRRVWHHAPVVVEAGYSLSTLLLTWLEVQEGSASGNVLFPSVADVIGYSAVSALVSPRPLLLSRLLFHPRKRGPCTETSRYRCKAIERAVVLTNLFPLDSAPLTCHRQRLTYRTAVDSHHSKTGEGCVYTQQFFCQVPDMASSCA